MKTNLIQEKSFQFSLCIIKLYKELVEKREFILSRQLLKSGTSIGANIEEALGGVSKKEFKNKMSIALKEARETNYWLKLLKEGNLVEINVNSEIKDVISIINILYKIVKTSTQNINKKIAHAI